MKKYCLFCLATVLLTSSCFRHTCPVDDALQKSNADAPEYTAELVKRLKGMDTDKPDYYVDKYIEDSNRQYLRVEINSSELCAFVTMDITGCHIFDDLKRKKGKGYISAGLSKPKFSIDSSDGNYRFVLESVDDIID